MRTGNWRAVALAAPGCALSAGLAVALVCAASGRSPIWPDHRLTLSEAVVMRADADIARLIGYGDDPNAPSDVRPGLLADRTVRVTPLEAATLSREAGVLEHLLRNGALIEPLVWNRLRCLAGGDESVTAVLERHRPAGAVMRCDDVSPP